MIINTKNPSGKGRCIGDEGGVCPLPKNSWAPKGAKYSGILECPCTDRLDIHVNNFTTVSNGICNVPPPKPGATGRRNGFSMNECMEGAKELGLKYGKAMTVDDLTKPTGCFLETTTNSTNIVFNSAATSIPCGVGSQLDNVQNSISYAYATSLINVNISINEHQNLVEMRLTGPADVWFGIGFNAKRMSDSPYTIIVDGQGHVQERKLADHGPGSPLKSSLTITSNVKKNNNRTVIVTRPLSGTSSSYFNFTAKLTELNFINAIGTTSDFKPPHAQRTASTMYFYGAEMTICVCPTVGSPGKIAGTDFPYNCEPEPLGDLIKEQNSSCNITTYTGGLRCCVHEHFLLDSTQKIPEPVDT
eukprot:UN27876